MAEFYKSAFLIHKGHLTMANTPTANTPALQQLYVAYFSRPADYFGLAYWEDQMVQGMSIDTVAENFSIDTEYLAFAAGKTPAQLVNALYLNLFGRPAELAGLAYWVGELQSGVMTIAKVAQAIALGAQPADQAVLDNKVEAATAFTLALDTADEAVNYIGADAFASASAWLYAITDTDPAPAEVDAAVADATGTGGVIVAGQNFALTAGVDTIPGLIGSMGTTSTAGSDTIEGNSATFSPGDNINAGDGVDSLSLVLNEAATTYAGVNVSNVEQLVVRSIASNAEFANEVRISMSDFDNALQALTITKSTGNTAIEDLQGGVEVFINDVAGDVEIDFDNQNVPAAINISVNEFGESAGGMGASLLTIDSAVDTVNINDNAAGPGFYNTFDLAGGFNEVNVVGGANGTTLNMGIGSSSAVLDVDFTGNESDDKNIYVDMSAVDQSLTLSTGDYSDDVDLVSDSSDSITVALGEGDNNLDMGDAASLSLTAGSGDDSVMGEDVDFADIDLGAGNNSLEMDDLYDLSLTTGDGNDYANIGDVYWWADINLGEGDNQLYMDVVGNLNVVTGAGSDYVSTDDVDSANIDLGDGNNQLYMDDVSYLTVAAGAGDDYVSTNDVYWADINLGEGDNSLTMDSVDIATIVTGDGSDSVTIGGDNWWWFGGSRDLNISVGGGDDFVHLSDFYSGSGDSTNGLETSAGVSDMHIIDGGDGNDTLRLHSLDQADADGTFANITSIETLQLSGGGYWWWGTTGGGSLDGVITGANAAGVTTYEFLNGNYDGEDITLTNVVNNVTVSMELNDYYDSEGQNFTLTQTPDDGANVANVHFDMNDYYYWGSDTYSFGDITVDTTEVLNLSGTDDYWWWWSNDTLEIQGLYSADLTTLNLSGNLAFDFSFINAPNLAQVDATGMTDSVGVNLDVVAAAITVLGGSADDSIVLNDMSSALTAFGGDGDDYIEGNMNNDVLHGDDGDDILFAGAGIDMVYGGAGDDLIEWDAAELFAVDLIDGGADFDTVDLTGSLGVQNDSFFYQWSDVERLNLDAGNNVLTLGIIASDAGLEEIHLSDDGEDGGDTIILQEGWSNDTAIYLSNGDDTVLEAPSVGVDLRVYADGSQVDAGDTLTGANGSDTLFLTADNWWYSNLSNVTGFETVMVVADEDNYVGVVTSDSTIAAGQTLTIDGRALVLGDYDGSSMTPDTAGSLYVEGLTEADGQFLVWGGDGSDFIYTGAGNDTINAGEGDNEVAGGEGNDVITAGAGDDEIWGGWWWSDLDGGNNTINAGDGNNTVYGADGNDSITAGAGDDEIYGGDGDDVIAAGNGTNYIEGGLGADQMSGGSDVDTYSFGSTDAQYGNADIITGFNAGGNGVLGADLIETWAGVSYLGAYANATLGLLALQANSGGIEAVLVTEVDGQYLYIDVNGDDAFSNVDAAIKLVGLTGTLDQSDFIV